MEKFLIDYQGEFIDNLSPYSKKILKDYQSYLQNNYLK